MTHWCNECGGYTYTAISDEGRLCEWHSLHPSVLDGSTDDLIRRALSMARHTHAPLDEITTAVCERLNPGK